MSHRWNILLSIMLFGLLSCILLFQVCLKEQKVTEQVIKVKKYKSFNFLKTTKEHCNIAINVYIQFVDAETQIKLREDFILLTSSLLSKTNCELHFYIVTDNFGITYAEEVFIHFAKIYPWFVSPERIYYRIENFTRILGGISKPMKVIFSGF